MTDGQPQSDLAREVVQLKRLVQEQCEEINQLKEDGAASIVESLGLKTPAGRRQALKYDAACAGLPALLAYAASQEGQADAVAAGVGTQGEPWRKVWPHAIKSGDGDRERDVRLLRL